MTSTGNDIVALGAINVDRTKHPNFCSRIIVDAEKALYDNDLAAVLPLEHFVWLAWSVKESVYKFLQRGQHDLVFSPSRIVVGQITPPSEISNPSKEGIGFDDESVYHIMCSYMGHKLYARSIKTSDYIFSVANDHDDFSHVYWGIKNIGSSEPEVQSAEARDLALHKLHGLFPDDHFKIGKSLAGLPIIFKNGMEADMPLSLAHHDHFVGYSFLCMETVS